MRHQHDPIVDGRGRDVGQDRGHLDVDRDPAAKGLDSGPKMERAVEGDEAEAS